MKIQCSSRAGFNLVEPTHSMILCRCVLCVGLTDNSELYAQIPAEITRGRGDRHVTYVIQLYEDVRLP